MSLASEIAGILEVRGIQWRVDGELNDVTEEMAQKVLDRLAEMLYDGDNYQQASTGGILIVKNDGHLDVYVHIGEHNGNSHR